MLLTAKVRDRTGLERFIEREALSSSDLAAQLRHEGMVVLSVTESEGLSLKTKKRHLFSRRRMSTFSVEMGLRQLSSMLSSGVALLLSLRTVSEQSSTKKANKLWADVADRIYGGSSFSAALEENIKRNRNPLH